MCEVGVEGLLAVLPDREECKKQVSVGQDVAELEDGAGYNPRSILERVVLKASGLGLCNGLGRC